MNMNRLKMRNVIATAICLAVMTAISGCEKNPVNDANNPVASTRAATPASNDVNKPEGVYAGTYTWTNLTNDWSLSSAPTIELKAGKYTYNGLSNGSFFDSGSGNFTVEGNKIIFELTDCPKPMQTIGVIDSWQLNGEYEYKVDGDKLIFSKTSTLAEDEYRYEFKLKKDTGK
jgi:hypothetical protein